MPVIQPEPSTAPERSRAETRRRLVAAGTELFARRGLAGTPTAQIARRAGVAVGTFYLHFSDKQALFREIVFDALARLRERMAAAREGAGANPAQALRASTAELLAFAEANRSLVRVLFGRDPEAADLGEAVMDELLPGVEARLRQGVETGALAPELHPTVAAQALVAMWTRVLAWWVEEPTRAPRESVLETLVRLHPLTDASA